MIITKILQRRTIGLHETSEIVVGSEAAMRSLVAEGFLIELEPVTKVVGVASDDKRLIQDVIVVYAGVGDYKLVTGVQGVQGCIRC